MMQSCVKNFIDSNNNSALLLVDIGAFPFRDMIEKYSKRVKNIGIFEDGTISIAAGLALSGIVPTIYGISPFIVQRALEQLKLDFVYQKLGGNFITTGASYDFSTLGYSHYCPEDVGTLYQLPGFEILCPSTPKEFAVLWNECHNNGRPSYFRMTDYCCNINTNVKFGCANVLKIGRACLVIAVAETVDKVVEACQDIDVTILYYTTLQPFDKETLIKNFKRRIFIVEPFYKGTVASIMVSLLAGRTYAIDGVGVPREVLRNYGTKSEKDRYCGLTVCNIKKNLLNFLGNKN